MRKMKRAIACTFLAVIVLATASVLWKKRDDWIIPAGRWIWGSATSFLVAGSAGIVNTFDNHQGTAATLLGILGIAIQVWGVLRQKGN